MARKPFDAYLISSDDSTFVTTNGIVEAVERRVDLLHQRDRLVVGRADDDPVGLHEVLDRRALAEKLGIGDDRHQIAFAGLAR